MVTRRNNSPTSWNSSRSFVIGGSLALCAVVATLAGGCATELEPLPSVYDDPDLSAQVADADGIDGTAPRVDGFVHGRAIRYWTIAGGAEATMPFYQLCQDEDGACAPIDHPVVVDRLPGDDGYSAFGRLHLVRVPAGWGGRLSSLAAIEEAAAAGEIEAPVPTSTLLHCPIAGDDARIEVSDGVTAPAERPVYFRDREARCFDFSATRDNRALLPDGMLVRNVYALFREGEDMPVAGNTVFGVGLEDADYTPLWRLVRVTVPADYAHGDIDDSAQMFDVAPDYTITPIDGAFVDHEITDTLINCPLQSEDGVL